MSHPIETTITSHPVQTKLKKHSQGYNAAHTKQLLMHNIARIATPMEHLQSTEANAALKDPPKPTTTCAKPTLRS